MKQFLKLIIFSLSLAPISSFAQTVNFETAKSVYNVGEKFLVTVSLNTQGKSVNTVSGTVGVPSGDIILGEIRSGQSIISLWVESPKVQNATIPFTGGTPGGYNGANGPIFSFIAEGNKEGSSVISLSDLKILLNDGEGTQVSVPNNPSVSLRFVKAAAVEKTSPPPGIKTEPPKKTILPTDATSPESFIPLISRHPSIENNKYFVSFFAVDKDSGIERYEVSETPWPLSNLGIKTESNSSWTAAVTPYVLQNQIWPSRVTVRAYDRAGNITLGYADKPLHPTALLLLIIVLILLSATGGYIAAKKPFSKKNAKIKW